jgi:hypothetical protein
MLAVNARWRNANGRALVQCQREIWGWRGPWLEAPATRKVDPTFWLSLNTSRTASLWLGGGACYLAVWRFREASNIELGRLGFTCEM